MQQGQKGKRKTAKQVDNRNIKTVQLIILYLDTYGQLLKLLTLYDLTKNLILLYRSQD